MKVKKVKNNLHIASPRIYFFICQWRFCHLLKIFENSLDPDQNLQNVGRDMDPNHLTLCYYSRPRVHEIFFNEKLDVFLKSANDKIIEKFHSMWIVNVEW